MPVQFVFICGITPIQGNARAVRRFANCDGRVTVAMDSEPPDSEPPAARPIEEWTDQELLDQYRYVKAEFAQEPEPNRDNRPRDVLEEEIRRRGLSVPTGASAESPGRERGAPRGGSTARESGNSQAATLV